MILNSSQVNDLGGILLDFEVAYRSIVSNKLINKYPSEDQLKNKISELVELFKHSPSDGVLPAYFVRFKSKIKKYTPAEISKIYKIIKNCHNSTINKSYGQNDDHVFFVAEIIDFILFLYNPLFIPLGSKFGDIEHYEEQLNNFKFLRNATSHRASVKINHDQTRTGINFVLNSLKLIPDEFFWYVSKEELETKCKSFLQDMSKVNRIKHNLHRVTKKHKLLLERQDEYKQLKERILGSEHLRRTSGTVLVQGSGGVGKTALALELCYEILANEASSNISFISWLTAKEEELGYNTLTGEIQLDPLKPQYSTLDDVISTVINLIGSSASSEAELINDFEEINGLIVLDNFETIREAEQEKIKKFISNCPESIQFVITSRPTDNTLESYIFGVPINLFGFTEKKGKEFVKKYFEDNNFNEAFSDETLSGFVKEACGNPLVMVTSLQRTIEGLTTIDEIINTLRNYGSSEVEKIADFMYKNMMENTILNINSQLESEGLVEKVLNMMFLYDEPIDLYSLRDLTSGNPKDIEYILNVLSLKYIVSKQSGLYKLDELAIKFILIRKTLPDKIILNSLKQKISAYKRDINAKLEYLESSLQKSSILKIIISNWNPLSYTEKIATAQAYNSYRTYLSKLENCVRPNEEFFLNVFNEILNEFDNIKYRGNHPYIKFQLARVLKLLFRYKRYYKSTLYDKIITTIENAYSDSLSEIISTHNYIIGTKSYPALLMQYGAFLLDNYKPLEAIKHLDECATIYTERFYEDSGERVNRLNSYYYLAQATLLCSTLNNEFEKQYLEKCMTSVNDFYDLSKKVNVSNVNDYGKKYKIINLLNLYCILKLKNSNKLKLNTLWHTYNSNKRVILPPALSSQKFLVALEKNLKNVENKSLVQK